MASKELKEERRTHGLCVYCGRPAVIKADGTPARRCEKCSGSHVRQKRDARHGIETRGRITGRSRGHVEQKAGTGAGNLPRLRNPYQCRLLVLSMVRLYIGNLYGEINED